jgi:hypothetical protein
MTLFITPSPDALRTGSVHQKPLANLSEQSC